MEKKVFSIEDGTLQIIDSNVILLENDYKPIASIKELTNFNGHLLPMSLITPKTDEELAEEYARILWDEVGDIQITRFCKTCKEDFIAGRKSVGGEFHLTREQLVDFAYQCSLRGYHSVGDMIFLTL